MRKIKVDDEITYRTFGSTKLKFSKVTDIEICRQGLKYGRHVKSCDLDRHSNVIIDLEDNRWCYKNQIVEIKST